MLVAARLYRQRRGEPPLVALDDLSSELDVDHQRRALLECAGLGAQLWVTGTQRTLAMDESGSGSPDVPRGTGSDHLGQLSNDGGRYPRPRKRPPPSRDITPVPRGTDATAQMSSVAHVGPALRGDRRKARARARSYKFSEEPRKNLGGACARCL